MRPELLKPDFSGALRGMPRMAFSCDACGYSND